MPGCIDLLWHLPQGLIDRALTPRIADARIGELATLEVTVTEHRRGGPRRGARGPYRVLVEDDSGALELVYFNADPAYLKRLLPEGSRRLISGKLESYDGWLQMPHPDHVVAVDDTKGGTAKLPLLEPIYPLTAGLTNTSSAQGHRPGARRASPVCLNGSTRLGASRMPGRASPTRFAACMRLRPPPISKLPRRRGCGSPMTSCSPISSRSP